jgi:rhodanese-related sulfurtransferase
MLEYALGADMAIRRLARSLLSRALRRESTKPTPPRTPPPFVPNPAEAGLETPPEALLQRQADGEQFVFIDVRADNERERWIPDALNISIGELTVRWGEVADLSGTPLCYCATGGQSINAASLLRERGLTHATCILGGLPAWEDAGGAIEQVD